MLEANHYVYKTHLLTTPLSPFLAALRSLSLSRSPKCCHQRLIGDLDVQLHPHFLCSLFSHHFLLTLGLLLPLTPSYALDSGCAASVIKYLISQVCVRAAGPVAGRHQQPALLSSVSGVEAVGSPYLPAALPWETHGHGGDMLSCCFSPYFPFHPRPSRDRPACPAFFPGCWTWMALWLWGHCLPRPGSRRGPREARLDAVQCLSGPCLCVPIVLPWGLGISVGLAGPDPHPVSVNSPIHPPWAPYSCTCHKAVMGLTICWPVPTLLSKGSRVVSTLGQEWGPLCPYVAGSPRI